MRHLCETFVRHMYNLLLEMSARSAQGSYERSYRWRRLLGRRTHGLRRLVREVGNHLQERHVCEIFNGGGR